MCRCQSTICILCKSLVRSLNPVDGTACRQASRPDPATQQSLLLKRSSSSSPLSVCQQRMHSKHHAGPTQSMKKPFVDTAGTCGHLGRQASWASGPAAGHGGSRVEFNSLRDQHSAYLSSPSRLEHQVSSSSSSCDTPSARQFPTLPSTAPSQSLSSLADCANTLAQHVMAAASAQCDAIATAGMQPSVTCEAAHAAHAVRWQQHRRMCPALPARQCTLNSKVPSLRRLAAHENAIKLSPTTLLSR
jgi:hypothetical protein